MSRVYGIVLQYTRNDSPRDAVDIPIQSRHKSLDQGLNQNSIAVPLYSLVKLKSFQGVASWWFLRFHDGERLLSLSLGFKPQKYELGLGVTKRLAFIYFVYWYIQRDLKLCQK